MAELENKFTWSRSRDGMFRDCHRKYWLNYYGSWGGWKRNAPPLIRQTYVLKQVRNRWMWVGVLVHDAIAGILKEFRDGFVPNIELVKERTVQEMRNQFRSSRSKVYFQYPKTGGLFEHHYPLPDQEIDWVAVRDHLTHCLDVFWQSSFRQDAETLDASDWLSIEEMDNFDLEGTTVWAIPDFAYRRKDGTVCIVDWKTGRKMGDPDPIQLACYSLYGSQRWNVSPEEIMTVEYNLSEGRGHERKMSKGSLETVTQEILQSVKKMQELLDDISANQASENRFISTEDQGRCRGCRYKEICFSNDWHSRLHAPA